MSHPAGFQIFGVVTSVGRHEVKPIKHFKKDRKAIVVLNKLYRKDGAPGPYITKRQTMPAVIKLRLLVFLCGEGCVQRFQVLDTLRTASALSGAARLVVPRHVDDMHRIPEAA